MSEALHTRVLRTDAAFGELSMSWNALLDATPEATPWQSLEYVSAWWRRLRGARELRIVVVERAGLPCLLLPLQISRIALLGVPVKVLEPLGMPDDINRPSFVLGRPDTESSEAAAQALWTLRGEWDFLRVDERGDDSGDVRVLRSFAEGHGLPFRKLPLHPCPHLVLEGAWEEFLRSRGPRLRKNLRAARRALEARGPLRLECASGPEEIDRAFDVALDVQQRSWKARESIGLSQSDDYREFTREILQHFAARDSARILILWCGACPVAATIAFMRGDTYHSAHIAHDEAYSDGSPGTLLEALELEGLWSERRFKYYDFLGAALANKRRWTDSLRPTSRVMVMGRSMRARCLDAWYFSVKPALKAARAHVVD